MADALDYYPPAPASVPPDLTTPTSGYRLRVIVVLTSLFLFVLLYLGLVAGSAYVCYYAFFAPERASEPRAIIQGLFQQIGKVEQQVSKVYNDALEQSKRGMMDDARFLQVLERDLLPPWRAERQRLAGMEGLPPEEQRFVEQFSRYVQLREEGWELLSRAIRQNDLVLAEQGKGKSEEADRLATQISAEGARYASLSRPEKRESRGWLVIAGIASGLLCLFLMKGFFKWRRIDPSMRRVEVTEKRQPILFAFIRQLCRDTRAPFPHRVYLTADVNAAVFYHESFLSLFLPTPKNLVIGLGLVNHLNLSEFKAVLAHEFGHFSQRSMKLGSYVYMSNRIIGELVFGRDWVDDTVDSVRSLRGLSGAGVDVRVLMLAFVVAAFAWAFTGLLWGLRKALQGLFQVINFANSSLSRQMEFNADLVAVSVTGSDALIHGLARLDFAADSLSQAWIDLTAAADHQLFTRDFFYHQTRAADYLRALRKDPRLGEPPALPEDPQHVAQVFRPEDTSIPKMWATHPTNHDRETNAKRQYIRCPIDERSPWILFQEVPVVRETVTRQLYAGTQKLTQAELKAPEVVQAFIDQEHTETTYDLRYHGLYDRRHIVLPNIESLMQTAGEFGQDPGRLATAHVRLYGEELKARMAVHQTRQQEYALLAPLTHGHVELTGKDFLFRGARYRAAEAKRLLDQVQAELKEDFDWMGSLAADRKKMSTYSPSLTEQTAAPSHGGIFRFWCSKSHRPPRQVRFIDRTN